jgi:hypothetical protein
MQQERHEGAVRGLSVRLLAIVVVAMLVVLGAPTAAHAGPATTALTVSGIASPTVSGTAKTVTVTAKTSSGSTDTTYTGQIHFTSSDPQAVLPANYTFTLGDAGTKTFPVTLKTASPPTHSVTATEVAPSPLSGTQSGITVTPGPTSRLAVTGISSPIASGSPSDVTVRAVDDAGNTTPAYQGTVRFTSSAGSSVLPADYPFGAGDAGLRTFAGGVVLKVPGVQSVTATDTATASITGTQSNIDVVPFLVVSVGSPQAVGVPASVVVTVKDAHNNTITGYTGQVHFTSDDPQAVPPPDYTFTGADLGSHTFSGASGVIFKSTGTRHVTVTDTAKPPTTGTSNDVTVNVGAPSKLVLSGVTSPTASGTASDVTVKAVDAGGNLTPSYVGTVHFTSSATSAALPTDYTFVAGDSGSHTFTDGVTLNSVGTQSVTATDTVTGSINGAQAGIVVVPLLEVTGIPATVTAGVQAPVRVTAVDADDTTITGYAGTVHFSYDDPAATGPANYTFNVLDAGTHQFNPGVTFRTVGPARVVTVVDTAQALTAGAHAPVAVGPAAAATLTVSGISTPRAAGVPSDVTVAATDAFGNAATTYTGTVHFTSNDAAATLPANYTFVAGDNGTHTFSGAVTLTTAGTRSVTATDTVTGTITGVQSGIVVTSASVTQLLVTGVASPRTAGVPGNVKVEAKDAFGNNVPGYRGTIAFTSTDPQAVLPASYTFVAGDNGAHTFTGGVNLKTAGTQSVTATDAVAALSDDQPGIVVTPAAASTLVVGGIATPRTAGTASSLTVTAKDAFGNVATGFTDTVAFTSDDGQAVLPANYTFVAGDNGTKTFTGVVLKSAGTRSVTATDTAAGKSGVNGSQTGIAVGAAAATVLVVAGVASPRVAGVASDVTVTARDAFGNVADGYAGTVHFTTSNVDAALPTDYTFVPADAGAHTFTGGVVLRRAQTSSVTATDTVTGSITGAQTNIAVTPAPVASFIVTGITTPRNAGSASDVVVTAKDAFTNTATNYRGTVHFTSTDAQAALPVDHAFTAGDAGVFTATNGVTLKTAGTQTVTAADAATPAVKGVTADIVVNGLAVAKLVVSGANNPTAAGATSPVTVTATDQFGNRNAGYLGTIAFTSSDAAATRPAPYAFTAGDAGSHTFGGLVLRTLGTQSVTATDTGPSAFTGQQTGIKVVPVLTLSTITTPRPAGSPATVTVAATDAAGNLVPGYVGTVHFTSSDPIATLPADYTFVGADGGSHTFTNGVILKRVGIQSVTVTDTVNAPSTATVPGIDVTEGAAAAFLVSGVSSPRTAGTPSDVSISTVDAFGNAVSSYTGTVQLGSDDAQATFAPAYTFVAGDNGQHTFSPGVTLKTAGTRIVTATDTAAPSITGTLTGITVDVADPAGFAISGISSPRVAGVPSNLVITATDAFGNGGAAYTGTVHLTSDDAQALLAPDVVFDAGDLGTKSVTDGVTFKTAGTRSITATDTVTPTLTGGQGGIVVDPATATSFVVAGVSTPRTAGTPSDLVITARDDFGNLATGYLGTVHLTSDDPQATLPADTAFTAGDSGVHTFTGGAALKTVGTRSITATDTTAPTLTGTLGGLVVQPASAATLVVSGVTTPRTAGVPSNVTLTALDAFGNTATGYTGTVALGSDDPQAALAPAYTFVAGDAGQHTFANGVTLKSSGSHAVTATDTAVGSITGTLSSIIVNGASAVGFAVSGVASPRVAGTPSDLTITATDAFGNVASAYTGTVHLTSNDPQAALAPDIAFVVGDNSTKTVPGAVNLKTVGTRSVTVTDVAAPATTGSLGGITVNPASAATLVVSGITTPRVAGTPSDLVVTARDTFGNTATGYRGTVHVTSDDAQATLPANLAFSAADNGIHTFVGGVSLKTVGTRAVTVTDTATSTITGTLAGLAVTPATAATLTVAGVSSPRTAGVASNVVVTALDAFGNTATGYLGTVALSSNDAQATLAPAYTFVAGDAGQHTLPNGVTLKTAGTRSVTATDTTTNSITGTLTGISVTNAPVAAFAVSGISSPRAAGTASGIVLSAVDAFGNLVSSYTGTAHLTSTDPQAVLAGNVVFAAADNGTKTVANAVTFKTAGTQSVTATDIATASVTGTQGAITVTPLAASMLVLSGVSSPRVAGTPSDLVVTAKDTFGNVATAYRGTVHVTSNEGGAALPSDYTFTAGDNGIHTFVGGVVLRVVGIRTVTATDTTTSTITGTLGAIQVTPAVFSAFTMVVPAAALAGTPVTATVTARDAFGNVVTGYRGVTGFSSSDSSAVLPVGTAFTAADNGQHAFSVMFRTGGTQTLTVTDAAAAVSKTVGGIVVTIPPGPGYWLVASDGGIFSYGTSAFKGSTGGTTLNKPIVGMAKTKSGQGYWLVASDGGIFAFGDAVFHGSTGAKPLNQPIVGMLATPTGNGYWLVASDGGLFAFGDAGFFGSAGALKLVSPIVGMTATPSGKGYRLVGADGGIFSYGDAKFFGSTGAKPLAKPIVGMTPTPSGNGYWITASDGGIFAFGDAQFFGSTGATALVKPIVGMAATNTGFGYWLVASDGGIFSYGDATFLGAPASGPPLAKPIVGMASTFM